MGKHKSEEGPAWPMLGPNLTPLLIAVPLEIYLAAPAQVKRRSGARACPAPHDLRSAAKLTGAHCSQEAMRLAGTGLSIQRINVS